MSSYIDTHFDHHPLPSKRKLDDYDFDCNNHFTRMRKNSNSTSSKGKSVIPVESSSSSSSSSSCNSDGNNARLQLQFFVRMISGGKTLVLQANLNDTVEVVHRKIQLVTGIPVIEQRLIYRGKQLQWEQTLEECSVQNDAGLQLVGRMRSTDHPKAWRVINEMVSAICRICRKEKVLPKLSNDEFVREKLNEYILCTKNVPYKPLVAQLQSPRDEISKRVGGNHNNDTNRKKKELVDGDDDDDEEEEEEEEEEGFDDDEEEYEQNKNTGVECSNKIDYCKIFMDACAPQALFMMYMSSSSDSDLNRACASDCIRSFVEFVVKELMGKSVGRGYCATIVLEFCRLLRTMAMAEDDMLYRHCRSTLGSVLNDVKLASRVKEKCSNGYYVGETTACVAIQDVFPFFKEVGQKLVSFLVLTMEGNPIVGLSGHDGKMEEVRDFSIFLPPMLGFIKRGRSTAATSHKAKGRVSPSLDEVADHMLYLFNELLGLIDKCLGKKELCLAMKRKNVNLEVGWSQYLAILKELHNISVLYPGSEDQFWTTVWQNKEAVRGLVVMYATRKDDHGWLLNHKDILDFESKRHLAMLMFPEVKEDYEKLLEMLIDRSQLLAESFEYISNAQPSSLHAGLFMEFKNEEATGPGVLREWFCLVCQAIFDPQNALFTACPLDRHRFFPNPASKVDPLHLRYFRFSGRVIGLALMHKIQVGVVLDRAFFVQLAGRHVSIEDIRDADPCIYNSCKQILEMDAELVDSDCLGLTFAIEVEELGSRKVVELCSGGEGIAVNSKNRKEYVHLLVQHHFVTSISEQVSSFAQGFADILCDSKLQSSFFKSLELEDFDWMLHGNGSEISVEDWKAHTTYNGYKKSDRQVVWFWEVLEQLNAEQKKTLLFFWTSVKYLPIEGFKGLASRLYLYKSFEPPDRLPSSHTCFYRLCIPPYPSKAVMQDRLCVITQEHVGCSFGTW